MYKMECFARSIDPFFEIATRAVAELTNQKRYEIVYERKSTINRVKSADNQSPFRFRNLNGLARRLGVSARICMAHSAGMNPRLRRIEKCYDRNLDDKENFSTQLIFGKAQSVAANEDQEKKYCNEYDLLYSQHAVEDRIENGEGEINIPQMMYIFRNNWSEVIQISTTMSIVDENDGRYNCRIQVITIKARMMQERDGAQNQPFMRLLIAIADAHNHRNDNNIEDEHNQPNDNNMLDGVIADLAKVKL